MHHIDAKSAGEGARLMPSNGSRFEYRLAITDRRSGEVKRTGAQEREPRAAFTRLADDITVSRVLIERREVGRWEVADHA